MEEEKQANESQVEDQTEDSTTEGTETTQAETVLGGIGEHLKSDKKASDENQDQQASDQKESDTKDSIDYSDLKLPEDMQVDGDNLDAFKKTVASMNNGQGLSTEDAQKIIDLRQTMMQRETDELKAQFAEWQNEILSDKEIGGKNFDKKVLPAIAKAVDKYGDDSLTNLLIDHPTYSNNPSLVRFFYNVGKNLTEDKMVRGKPSKSEDDNQYLERMYGDK